MALVAVALAGCGRDAALPADTAMGVPTADAPATAPSPAPLPTATAPLGSTQVAVSSVDLGSAVGADNRVTAATTDFAPGDTVYASATTSGAAHQVPVTATWSDQTGQMVGTETRMLDTDGPATVAFQASRPGGWPAGTYKVEVAVGGNVVQTRQFTVR